MNTSNVSSLAGLLAQGDPEPGARAELRRQILKTLLPLIAVAAVVGVWSALAPLSGAVVAPAQVKVELNRKTVQHQEGGIVREILVRNGQSVRAGDPLVVVGDVRSDAELSLLQNQWHSERIRIARATAEGALAAQFDLPADIAGTAQAAEHLARERALFAARRRTLDEHVASLQAQMREAHAQAEALETQIAATQTGAQLSAEELAINDKLAQQGFVQRTRLLSLQRAESDYRARIGEYRSEAAIARQRIGELQARIAQARNQYQQQAADELKEASTRLREIEERLRPSRDQVERQFVRSPVDGEVMALRVSAVGEVIGPRDPLLDVVPAREKLVVEARIRPQDIDYVRKDASAEVRLTTVDARKAPPLPGKVVFVSADRVSRPETGESWFVATVEVDVAQVEEHPGLRLQAGMPAELFVITAPRTLFEYLAQPLGIFANRAMREP
jgi:HlyD family type I secretion membrane fusion protein